jgi:hypothetical protein
MQPTSITSINRLAEEEKREIYTRLIPSELIEHFKLSSSLHDKDGNDLLNLRATSGNNTVEMSLYHEVGFRDPILYGHLADTLNDQVHILLYIMNDPESRRYDVDKMPDGTATKFGTAKRNLEEEEAAMEAGLLPGQVRRGLGLATEAWQAFESFVERLGHRIFFVEPLYYHNAIIFERYGFTYQSGKKRMAQIQAGFSAGGELVDRLDGSTFRKNEAINSIRLRSWAIHDGILGEPYTNVTMYKTIGKHAGINTAEETAW